MDNITQKPKNKKRFIPLITALIILIVLAVSFVISICVSWFNVDPEINSELDLDAFSENKKHFSAIADYAIELYDKEKAENDDLNSINLAAAVDRKWVVNYFYKDESKNHSTGIEGLEDYNEDVAKVLEVYRTGREYSIEYVNVAVNDETALFAYGDKLFEPLNERLVYTRGLFLPDEIQPVSAPAVGLDGYRIKFTLRWFACELDFD